MDTKRNSRTKLLEGNNRLQRIFNWFYHTGLDRLLQRIKITTNENIICVRAVQRGRQRRHPTYYFLGVFISLPFRSTPATISHMSVNIVQFTGTLNLQNQKHLPLHHQPPFAYLKINTF